MAASINRAVIADLDAAFVLGVILIEQGGDNLAATFFPGFAGLSICVIETTAGHDLPRKRSAGATCLSSTRPTLPPHIGVDLPEQDTHGPRAHMMACLRTRHDVRAVVEFMQREGGLPLLL